MARDTTNDGEFSGGPGMIDAQRRKDRALGVVDGGLGLVGEELREIYATDPSKAGEDLATVKVERP